MSGKKLPQRPVVFLDVGNERVKPGFTSQVWCAAIAILLLEVLRLQSKYPWSFSNLIHNLRLNLLSFRLIEDWLNAPDQAVILVNAPAQQELFSSG